MSKKIEIRYFTRSGNTEKLAKAIGEELGIKAKDITHKLDSDVDILFLGSSVYATRVDDNIKKFIDDIDVKVRKVINFSTAALLPSTYKQIKKILNEKNIKISDKEFHCRGSFGLLHKSRPNTSDIEKIKKFSREIVKY